MFIDTHCHLDFDVFDSFRDELITKCNKLNITQFINPATQHSSWDKLIELNKQFKSIKIAFGLHPIFIKNHESQYLDMLEQYTIAQNTKLIGEIGLDKRVKDFDKQLDFFKAQISIANNLAKPVIIHSVKSHNEVIKILKDSRFNHGGIIHAFNGNTNIAKTYIELGFKLGIGGLISQPKAKLKDTVKDIPAQSIVLETDSPDMRLYGEKTINTPEKIPEIFRLLCDIYQSNTDILKQQIYTNSLEFI
ncbi:TatD family deoxyribonuclease [Francisella sp. Scap27]|uniref:TatD family hydrolase n=1 Tax=Francisella sp. Scap27 TaxID=2589986 RepID=UPI0015B79487|nr:TatD family hydrolase [Francisella sp. Scap27]QLE78659.1 TatD family deoxyribonuclease [Francisella sp. Scap27]